MTMTPARSSLAHTFNLLRLSTHGWITVRGVLAMGRTLETAYHTAFEDVLNEEGKGVETFAQMRRMVDTIERRIMKLPLSRPRLYRRY